MLFEKEIGEIFKTKEEAKLFLKFLENPKKAAEEILKSYYIKEYSALERAAEDSPLFDAVEKYIWKRGWLYEDERGEKHFLWERDLQLSTTEKFFPLEPEDLEKLKKVKEGLDELRRTGTAGFLSFRTSENVFPELISWEGDTFLLGPDLCSKALGREVKEYEELTFEEAYKVISWLYNLWEKLFRGAEKRGWISEQKGKKQFIWNLLPSPTIFVREDLTPTRPEEVGMLRELVKAVEEIKKKGAEKFLEFHATPDEQIWYFRGNIWIRREVAEKILGKEVKKWDFIPVGEGMRCLKELLRRWEKLLEEAEEKGWIVKGKRGEEFIWMRTFTARCREDLLPLTMKDCEELREIKEYLEELERKEAEKFLKVKLDTITSLREICVCGGFLSIKEDIYKEFLGEKGKKEALSFSDAKEFIEKVYGMWQKFLKEAEKRGWIWKDRKGERHFIWERNYKALPPSEEGIEIVKKIKRDLEELKEKGAEKFLEIYGGEQRGVMWYEWLLHINYELASEVLGREVNPGDRLSFEEALKILENLVKS